MTEFIDPGPRYLVVECAGCGDHITLGRAAGRDDQSASTPFEVKVTCPRCGLNGAYSPAQISNRHGNGERGLSLLD